MASIIEIINSIDSNSKEFESLVCDLMNKSNDLPFDNQQVDEVESVILTSINSRLNQANSRYNGLLILDKILPRLSKDILIKYSILWIAKATQMLENVHSSVQDITLACKVIGFLVQHCKEIPELHKQISMQNVKQLISALGTIQNNENCGAGYYLLAVLLHHYPEVCERFQGLLKKIILSQIDSTQENMVSACAKCFVLFSKVTERSFKPPPARSMYTGWTYNEALLCNSLHMIMDELFSGLIELESVDIWDQLELPSISEDNVIHYYNQQKQRFSNLCIYLSSMLSGYDVKNSVLPCDILGVLCRGLAITPLNLKNKSSFREQMLHIILPKLHVSLLTVLDAFIHEFGQELIPFGATILQLFQQTLEWTSTILKNKITFSNSKPFKSVRMYTYKCISSWLMKTGSLSGIETVAHEYVPFILKDVAPERDRILLTVQKTQHLSKRAIKRFKDSQYENSTVLNNSEAATKNTCLDADLCKEALITLQNIVASGNVLLKRIFYKNVQNTVIPLLYRFYLGFSGQQFYQNHNECRLELFKILKALQINLHTSVTFPIHYCLEISQMATYDIDLNIAQEAKLTLAELEKMIHPVAPTLQLSQKQDLDNMSTSEDHNQDVTNIKFDKRSRREEEISYDTDLLLAACKRQKITSLECQSNIETIEENDSTKTLEKIQSNGTLCENVVNTVEKNLEIHPNTKETQLNITEITNIDTENETESVIIRHVTTNTQEQDEQPENSILYGNEMSNKVEEEPSINSEEVERRIRNNDGKEELEPDLLESINLFHDEVKSND